MACLKDKFKIPTYLLRMFDNYLKNRALLYETKEGFQKTIITAGAAQGSILGPDLWNAVYDGLLNLNMPDESRLIAYADDVAALVSARDTELAQLKLNQVMRATRKWMSEHGLTLALNKTEVLLLTKKRIPKIIPIKVGDLVIHSRQNIKYLGVTIDSKLNFLDHIKETESKAAESVKALSRLMANVGGPSSSRRRLLMTTVQSILLYGAEIWADALKKESHRKRLARIQKQSALRISSAYRTVSEPAALVIAGVFPIKLLARERKEVFLKKHDIGVVLATKLERERTLSEWQASWNLEPRGRWTYRLIRNPGIWINRKHGEVNYFVTQLLSGHGYFRAYLKRMGKHATSQCIYCPCNEDDAEHTFFTCTKWSACRNEIEAKYGTLTPDSIIDIMLKNKEAWQEVERFVTDILKKKKVDFEAIEDLQ